MTKQDIKIEMNDFSQNTQNIQKNEKHLPTKDVIENKKNLEDFCVTFCTLIRRIFLFILCLLLMYIAISVLSIGIYAVYTVSPANIPLPQTQEVEIIDVEDNNIYIDVNNGTILNILYQPHDSLYPLK